MARKDSIFRQILDQADLTEEAVPGDTLVELMGDGRVLIERHRGVTQYCGEHIQVRTGFGAVSVLGCSLRLRLMTDEKLVIAGQIDDIRLVRGWKK